MKRGNGRGTEVGDNVQTAVDATPTLMVACEVTNDAGDRDWLSPMARQAQEGLACRVDAVADVGYDHGHEGKVGLEAGLTPYVARPITSANKKRGLVSKDAVSDESATDTDQGPAGARLTCRVDTVELGRHIRSYATSACTGCALKQQGTRQKGGRRMTRGVEEPLLEEMAPRVRRRPEVLKRRQELVEQPFGTRQRWGDAGDFFMRGRAKGRTAFSVTVLADTLRRVVNRVERPRLMAALGCDVPVRRLVVRAASP